MQILFLYPPVWKIPEPGEISDFKKEGPPAGTDAKALLSGDILHVPLGLLSLAAQARRSGHAAEVLNLISLPWKKIEAGLAQRPADIFGLSCFTANRRGTLSLARLIRKLHPAAHIAVGGPHATALAREMLEHCREIDTILLGEGEQAFAGLVQALAAGAPAENLAGTAFRSGGKTVFGPPQARIDELDRLAPACAVAADHIVMTSRGCAWNCSFCASRGMWGAQVRSHSPAYVLNVFDQLVRGCGLKALAVKDETFTLDRKRALEICRCIRRSGLRFLWSCDTRADLLDPELLQAMRCAGCVRISLGIESASQTVLAGMGKKLDPAVVPQALAHARELGFQIRLYMIAGAPGETREMLEESIRFVQECGATEVIWNPYTVFPGTRDYAEAVQAGLLDPQWYFEHDFFELTPVLGRHDEHARFCLQWLRGHAGLQPVRAYSCAERREIAARLPGLAGPQLDLAAALYEEGADAAAGAAAREALRLGYPLPGLCHNLLACIAARQGDFKAAVQELIRARDSGLHAVVEDNTNAVRGWVQAGAPAGSPGLILNPDCSFEITRRRAQPLLPGPLADRQAVTS